MGPTAVTRSCLLSAKSRLEGEEQGNGHPLATLSHAPDMQWVWEKRVSITFLKSGRMDRLNQHWHSPAGSLGRRQSHILQGGSFLLKGRCCRINYVWNTNMMGGNGNMPFFLGEWTEPQSEMWLRTSVDRWVPPGRNPHEEREREKRAQAWDPSEVPVPGGQNH